MPSLSTLVLSLFSLVVCIVAALPQSQSQPRLLVHVPAISVASIGRAPTRRQVTIGNPSPLPSQCASTCSPVNNEVSLGCPVEACCTTTFETTYYDCLWCVGTALNAANFSTAQNSLNLLYTTCVDMGFVLPRLELPGQSNSSTATASATALFPTGSSGSDPATPATGAAVAGSWHGLRVQALIGAVVLVGIAGLW